MSKGKKIIQCYIYKFNELETILVFMPPCIGMYEKFILLKKDEEVNKIK